MILQIQYSYFLGMEMELRHLRYIIAVAEEGHITRAAERLGMQQPPLSRQIKAIEREIDVQLFRRKPRGVELTDAGRAFLDGARAMFAGLDQTLESTRRTARGEFRTRSMRSWGTPPPVTRVIREFREFFPLVGAPTRSMSLLSGRPLLIRRDWRP